VEFRARFAVNRALLIDVDSIDGLFGWLSRLRSFVRVSLCGVGFPLANMNRVRGVDGSWNLSTPNPLI
jgi:hypothetical protein